jgi:hypothetical protein
MRHPTARLFAVLVPLFAVPAAAQLAVTGVTPANNARGVSPAATVTLTFNQAVDPNTITAQNVKLAGRWSGPVPCTLTVGAGGTTVTLTPQRALFATEIATLTVTHFVATPAFVPLTGGFMAMWWVDAAPSSGTFVLDHVVDYRNPGEGLIRTYGFFAGDVDRDGSPDMSSTNEVSFDVRLMKNDGCGHFGPKVISPLPNGTEPSPNEGADFNGDGWIDLATGNQNGQSVAVFLNSGAGSYLTPTVMPVGGPVHGIALLDADSDGDVDIVATNQSNIALLRNNGNGTFQPPTYFDGGGSGEWAIGVADANGDGRPDIFCGTYQSQLVTLLLGNGAGTFTPSASRSCGGFPWQMAVGDVDGDGNVDCVVAEATNGRAAIVRGTGAGGLVPMVAYPVGSNPVSVDIGDFEGDDDLDIVIASYSNANATMLRNNGLGVFGNATTIDATAAGSCAVIVDFDRDGDTDVILVDELDDKGFVYRQVGPSPTGVQSPTCEAALRVNSFANRGGYGGAASQLLPGGAPAFFNISGKSFQFAWLVAGTQLQPGVPAPLNIAGILNLNMALPMEVLVTTGLDAFGESTTTVAVPNGLPPGSSLTMQCLLTTATGFAVSNPERVVF